MTTKKSSKLMSAGGKRRSPKFIETTQNYDTMMYLGLHVTTKTMKKVIKIYESRREMVVTRGPPPRSFSLGDPINLLYDLIEVKKNCAQYLTKD